MTPRSELELQGNFLMHPFAELVAEIGQSRLNGSLRASDKEKKCVVYFKAGEIAFAVSNARSSRLFDMMLKRNQLQKEDIAQIPKFENDFEFAEFLKSKNYLSQEKVDQLFVDQIESIIVDLLTWTDGDWTFTSLARIRDGLEYKPNTVRLLLDYGRTMPVDRMLSRFRSLNERYRLSSELTIGETLAPEEAFVLSRAASGQLTAEDLVNTAGISESRALHIIYTLWLGGFLVRNDWNPAFPGGAVAHMQHAKLELRQEAKIASAPTEPAAVDDAVPEAETTAEPGKADDPVISLEEYLTRVEGSETHYDILGVDTKAEIAELKKAYFMLAKMFHPDRYHAEGGDQLKRIQNAFTMLAQAHETLKNPESREVYDYRMRKEISEREKREAGGTTGSATLQMEQASESFDRGFDLLMANEPESALQFLARAVHYAPENARYHAYYGKALSFDEKKRHKAESEMQAAVKLDQDNPTYRIMLSEFFVQYKLYKRAEGELNRLLAIFPSNREAREMLDTLKANA
ncbi:MAG: DnaJ domain-containing protein [Pyrinomonadaceae bacterium]